VRARIVSEFLGTAFLLLIVVGSGIMGERLAQGNEAVALLANSLATGAGLFVLIQTLGPISGAHFNPVVSLVESFWGRLDKGSLVSYTLAQLLGAVAGILLTHAMFHREMFEIATKDRASANLWLSEVVATFGLICTIALAGRKRVEFAPMSVAAYITGAYWFTSSTSFANPAVTIGRMFTNTFCGIAPNGVVPFVMAQIIGALTAYFLLRGFFKKEDALS
jgi:glycerol uptake facilitator-like aquaporin